MKNDMQKLGIYRDLLCGLLNCGYLDLQVIEDIDYDMEEILENLKFAGFDEININTVMMTVFDMARGEVRNYIDERIEELKEDEDELSSEDKEELELLQQLEVFEDIESYHNYLDTGAYINSDVEDVYKTYCKSALDLFEEKTGYSLY